VKIALFTTSFPSQRSSALNAGVCVKDFADTLTELGHEVEVLSPYKRGARHDFAHQGTTFFRWLGSSESVSHINLLRPIGALQSTSIVLMGSLAALRLTRRFRPDHVLCFWVFPSGLWGRVACMATGAPYSLWALGSDIWTLGKVPGMPKVLRWLARGAACRYADGPTLAQDFSKLALADVTFLATSRVLEIPTGVRSGEGGYYLFLGRYHSNKGIDLLIDAIASARRQLPSTFRLRAHGFGPLEGQIRSRVKQLGLDDCITIGGPTPSEDVAAVLRRAQGLVIPSRIESVPLVLSDGLRMQVPLLVTDVGDMGHLVRQYEAGMVCRPDASAIAAALVQFVATPPLGGNAALLAQLDIRQSARHFLNHIGPTGS
jgi:glycosyltransferase involved in cell wall biosynthesis